MMKQKTILVSILLKRTQGTKKKSKPMLQIQKDCNVTSTTKAKNLETTSWESRKAILVGVAKTMNKTEQETYKQIL